MAFVGRDDELAQPDLTRVPVAVGAAKWGKSVNGGRLRYIVCARSEVVTLNDSDTITITARDIFPGPL